MVLHTLAAFAGVARLAGGVVAVAPGDRFFAQHAPLDGRWRVAACGGATRADSVANGLAALQAGGASDEDWAVVHDAARCLVTTEQIDRLVDACMADAVGGLLALPLSDTLKMADAGRVGATIDRAGKWLAQTPQMFRIGILAQALRTAEPGVTDESSAMEAVGLHPLLVTGSALNFKVTWPEDFALAEAVLDHRKRVAASVRRGG
ncbi:2-C-methyl-D-erythritol 4-phosphate cytidylyltransferase [Xylophilus ampelinus]|uniref:2-C-methyl-D-erythritol 4-phosphate cytidylyltransferase n=2 Tax=Xylophilus ampelinus TaxID=54067 RepID=A0A318SKN4_9BURK|nr:2-C-methyl-D-erythritol 4-phosphate cytidylyltransferase [Xylophilus ampelinus]